MTTQLSITQKAGTLKRHLEKASSILLVTHKNCDHDAICSILLLNYLIMNYFKKKVTAIVQERSWPRFASIQPPGLKNITCINPETPVDTKPYDLIIMADCSFLERAILTEENMTAIENRLIIIDHHDVAPSHGFLQGVIMNCSSAAELIYRLFNELVPDIHTDIVVAELTQIGIIADTNRFMYAESISRQTFEIMGELFETNPINIELLYYDISKTTRNSIYIFDHIVQNLQFKDDMAYSFVDPEFLSRHNYAETDFDSAKTTFLQIYLRAIEGVNWGFLLYKSRAKDNWKVSFRSIAGTVPVVNFAQALGGGGHTNAGSGTVEAETLEDAIHQVLDVIEKTPHTIRDTTFQEPTPA